MPQLAGDAQLVATPTAAPDASRVRAATVAPAAPIDHDAVDWRKLAVLILQLGGLLVLAARFNIESAAFLQLMVLSVVGFVAQYFLPRRHRLSWFVALSLASIALVLGAAQAAYVAALGLGLLAVAHLPAPFSIRVGLLVAAGLGLAALRGGWGDAPWSGAVWPILGAMFMFRLIVYMYDVKHGQAPALWTQRLAYFFMLPNVCFPLFPVVDPRTFVRSHFAGERHEIHQRGVEWILRGFIQLILYRVVYIKAAIDPYDVATTADLVHYCLWLFLLYLRVSGQFHVIVGILHLFGFQLPETHRRYYFASSFTDFWRRINIYWKDFMMKVFYYPMFFRTKRYGATAALVISTVVVFALTWALHAYQLFWIRGFYVFTWNDLLFWTILCGLVTVNALWEAKHGRRRSLTPRPPSWRDHAKLAIKTLLTFTVICTLWSFWSSESLEAWLTVWKAALHAPTPAQGLMLAAIAGGVALAISSLLAWDRWIAPRIERCWNRRAAATLVQLALLSLASLPAVYGALGSVEPLVVAARFGKLSQLDLAALERGYYEDLLTVERFNGELASLYAKRPTDWKVSLWDVGLAEAGDGLAYQLRPNAVAKFKGVSLRTNSHGLHDQEYELGKPPRRLRMALLGASHAMGSGVERERTFEALVESQLNEANDRTRFDAFEILNFAVYGYCPLEQLVVLERRAGPFDCDVVLYVGHPGDAKRVIQFVAREYCAGATFAEPWVDDVLRQAGVKPGMPARLVERQLEPWGEELLTGVYRRMVEFCRAAGQRPVFVYLPMAPKSETTDLRREPPLADAAGFAVVDLDGVYEGHDRQSLWLAEWDAHPNARGHELIANRLYDLLTQHPSDLLAAIATEPPAP